MNEPTVGTVLDMETYPGHRMTVEFVGGTSRQEILSILEGYGLERTDGETVISANPTVSVTIASL